jgi:hypothetical protein
MRASHPHEYVPLSDSHKELFPDAIDMGDTDPDLSLEISIQLRPRRPLPSPLQMAAKPPWTWRAWTSSCASMVCRS